MSDQSNFFGKLLTFEGTAINMEEERRRVLLLLASNCSATGANHAPPTAPQCPDVDQKPPIARS